MPGLDLGGAPEVPPDQEDHLEKEEVYGCHEDQPEQKDESLGGQGGAPLLQVFGQVESESGVADDDPVPVLEAMPRHRG